MSDPKNPLHSVSIVRPDDRGTPNASVAAVGAFNQAAAEASSVAAEGEAEEEAATPAPPLDSAQLEALAYFQLMQEARGMEVADLATSIEEAKRLRKRNEQIEARVPPIQLSQLLLSDKVTQVVPVVPPSGSPGEEGYDPGLSLEFRTIAADVELDADEAAASLMEQWARTGSSDVSRSFVQRTATMVCGLVRIDTAAQAATRIHAMPADTLEQRKERQSAIATEIRAAMSKPVPLLDEIHAHQRMFTYRVRKALQSAGFVESEVGNS